MIDPPSFAARAAVLLVGAALQLLPPEHRGLCLPPRLRAPEPRLLRLGPLRRARARALQGERPTAGRREDQGHRGARSCWSVQIQLTYLLIIYLKVIL